MGTTADALAAVLPSWQSLLQDWARSGKLYAAAQEALLLDGEPQALRDLAAQWSAGVFSAIPEIVLLSNGEISGAMGAYAVSTGKIYLNEDWLPTASAGQVTAVLTEELGHHLDALLNTTDTPGDEGEYLARLLSGELPRQGSVSALQGQVDTGVISLGGNLVPVENANEPVLRGNSLYTIVAGPSWTQAETNSVSIGGHLITLNNNSEWQWFKLEFTPANGYAYPESFNYYPNGEVQLWVGLNDATVEGSYQWISGESSSIDPLTILRSPNDDYGVWQWEQGLLTTYPDGVTTPEWQEFAKQIRGVAEVPLTLSITRSATPKEGAGLFTTSINLSAGNQTSGNLAEGATVYWKISGIDANDLSSGSLTGSGTITNSKLDIQHSLAQDADTQENFDVSVYSDAGLTQQIGSTSSTAVQEASDGGTGDINTVLWGSSIYTVTSSLTWTNAEAQASGLGGHLIWINNASENTFVQQEFAQYLGGVTWDASYLWTGGQYGASGGIYWNNGSEYSVEYTNWAGSGGGTTNFTGYRPIAIDINGKWWTTDDSNALRGIAEVPVDVNINQSTSPTEGAGLFTTSINLSAGTQTSGNLAEGATVYWKITGISTDDLALGTLAGSGVVTNGKLDIQHSLVQDSDTGDNFQVSVFSDAGLTQQIGSTNSIGVQEGNSAPTDLSLTSSGIQENSAAATVIGTLAATDPDASSSFTYALVAGNGSNDADNALVEIVGNEVRVKSGASIDFETNPLLNLNIQVTDNGTPGLTYTKALTASVLNSNEAPTDLSLTSSGIQENSAAATVIGTLAATDPDASSSFTYALVAGNGSNDADNALVEIVGNEVRVKSGASIDFETNPLLNLNIQVTDNGTPGLTFTKAVTAAVLDIYEAPASFIGDANSNTLVGDNNNNRMSGQGVPRNGVDNIDGLAGTDTVYESGDYDFALAGTTTAATIVGTTTIKQGWTNNMINKVNDSLKNVEIIEVTGGASSNTITAQSFSGTTYLNGGGGNDLLIGGLGTDFLTGGTGGDRFRFAVKPIFGAATADHITDFRSAETDMIQISKSAFGINAIRSSLTVASDPASLTTALARSSLFVFDSSNGNLYWNQNGSADGFGTGGIFAVLDPADGTIPTITASNIALI